MSSAPNSFFRPEEPVPFDDVLIRAYLASGKSVDHLAYTVEFERIHETLQKAGDKRSIGEVYRRLLNLRKTGRLPIVA